MVVLDTVNKLYQGHYAVKEVSFAVEEGETLVLLGTSGSGKTTTLKMINRLVEPDSGSISFRGKAISSYPAPVLRRQIGYVIQYTGLFPHQTVFENIATVPRLLGWEKNRINSRVIQLMEMLGLEEHFLSRYPDSLSGGQKQRVGLARAMAADPPLILLDEPFGALDPITREKIQQDFKKIESLLNKTMIMVTHDVKEAFTLGQKIVLMDKGVVQQAGSPQQLLFEPANQFVRDFLARHRFQLELEMVMIKDLIPMLEPNALNKSENAVSIDGNESLGKAMNLADHVIIKPDDRDEEIIVSHFNLMQAFYQWKEKRYGLPA